MQSDETYMALALAEARRAGEIGEVPIGAVVVCEGALVASGHNRREVDHDPAGPRRVPRDPLGECRS